MPWKPAPTMGFGGRRGHQVANLLEDAERRDCHRAPAVEGHVMEETVAAGGPDVFRPKRIAEMVAGGLDLVEADFPDFEVGAELEL